MKFHAGAMVLPILINVNVASASARVTHEEYASTFNDFSKTHEFTALQNLITSGIVRLNERGELIVKPDIVEDLRSSGMLQDIEARDGGWTPGSP